MVTVTSYLQFSGLDHPVALEAASRLRPIIADVFRNWEYTENLVPCSPPFVTIKPKDRSKWSLVLADGQSAARHWDAVNVICDLVAEMAWERLRSDPSLLCLHAAALDFGGHLVVLPNARRAGKSTLAAALGHLGHRIYTDDFLPIRTEHETQRLVGVANGVAPRMRLPLPASFSDGLAAWVAQDPGPANKQYKYLVNSPVAPGDETMPLGAVIILDRKNDHCAPTLDVMSIQDVISTLVAQNFARTLHAGTILKSVENLAQNVPAFRLTYHCGEAAATFLSKHEAMQNLRNTSHALTAPPSRPSPLNTASHPTQAFEPTRKYIRASGVTETKGDTDHFLADGNGVAIHRLNAGSAAIWHLLKEPVDLAEVTAILAAAFDDVDSDKIAADSEGLMRRLAAARLIVPDLSNEAAP